MYIIITLAAVSLSFSTSTLIRSALLVYLCSNENGCGLVWAWSTAGLNTLEKSGIGLAITGTVSSFVGGASVSSDYAMIIIMKTL